MGWFPVAPVIRPLTLPERHLMGTTFACPSGTLVPRRALQGRNRELKTALALALGLAITCFGAAVLAANYIAN